MFIEAHSRLQEGPCFGVWDERFGVDALLFGVRGVAMRWSNFSRTREVCSVDSKEVWYARPQAYVYAHGDQLEED
jgi:hypothetical protein